MQRKKPMGALGFSPNFDEIKKRRELGEVIFPWQIPKNKKKLTDWQ